MSRIFVNFRDTNVLLICKATTPESAGVRRRQGRALACREKWPSSRCYNLKDGHIGPPTQKEFYLLETCETTFGQVDDLLNELRASVSALEKDGSSLNELKEKISALNGKIEDYNELLEINYPRGRAPGFVTVHRYRRPDTASRL